MNRNQLKRIEELEERQGDMALYCITHPVARICANNDSVDPDAATRYQKQHYTITVTIGGEFCDPSQYSYMPEYTPKLHAEIEAWQAEHYRERRAWADSFKSDSKDPLTRLAQRMADYYRNNPLAELRDKDTQKN